MTRRLLAAMSGWGKSYHAQGIMEASAPAFDQFVVLDYKDEYRGLVLGGLAKHFIVGPRETAWTTADWRAFLERNPKVVLARHQLPPETWREVCARIVQAVRQTAPTLDNGGLIAIDEAHFVAPQRGTVPDAIEGLATTGRGEGASSLWITQRLAKLEETVVSQADELLAGGFRSGNDRGKIDPEYPEAIHNPEATAVPALPSELQVDGENLPLRKFTEIGDDGEEHTVGSEWVYSDDGGNRERRNTQGMSMETTHYGKEGHPLRDPEY